MVTKALQQHKEDNDFGQFFKKLEAFVPDLQSFVAGSLRNAEDQGQLDRGYYDPDELLDEVYLDAFKAFSGESDGKKLQRSLFKTAIQKMAAKKVYSLQWCTWKNAGRVHSWNSKFWALIGTGTGSTNG